ncbi:MAG TPA: DNA polymerase III subunit alpha, partial [Planctomycetaceae bacterium]|nr:DNA polymerase III subunit alpha [Planctomycetaceae bacterium]
MSDPRPFAHLHCHTHFSMLDGASRIPEMVSKVKQAGMNSLAITDHGNLYGAMDFYQQCRSQDVNPILGLEAYIAPRSRFEKGASRMKEASFHLTLLAQNRQGFENLIKLSSMSYLEGFYYKPRIDKEILEAHSEGLILLTGCAAGELSHHILGEDWEEAEKLCAWYEKVFGDRVYMEIQNAGLEIQRQCLEGTVDLARKMGLPLVATNDAHYVDQKDAEAQDVLLCVSTRAVVSDEKRMKMTGDQFFVRTQEEMYNAFPGHEDAVARTQELAERVDIQMSDKKYYPVFQPPDNLTDTQYLRKLCEDRLPIKYGDELTQAHWDRLHLELGVIEQMGYSSYFLIVWDFVQFAENEGIPCTARGSACGAIVAFLLGMSQVCPLKYDLLFERFLDPSRTEPPDIDIDFCRDRRQLVIDYTKQKYGEKSVAQIGTFGTLKAKAAIRDVGRALGVPLARVNEIAKMIPESLGIKLQDALKESPDLQSAYDQDSEIRRLLDLAMQLEGLCRSAGTHAAGVV